MLGLWEDEARFQIGYLTRFSGYYFSGDGGYKDKDDYIYITGRVDDVINVAGHRLSIAEMKEIVASHNAVAECAVIGISDVLKVREKIGAVASLRNVIVQRLPKTRSGKILRKLLRSIIDGENYQILSTIDDEAIIAEVTETFTTYGIGTFK